MLLALFLLPAAGGWSDGGNSFAQSDCDASGNAWLSTYQMQSNYMPGAALNHTDTAYKEVHISFQVWRSDFGDSALYDNVTNRYWLNDVLLRAQPIYDSVVAPTDPIAGYNYSNYTDTKIRFVLDSVYFNDSLAMFFQTCIGGGEVLTQAAIALHPECAAVINIHLVCQYCCQFWTGTQWVYPSGVANLPVPNNFAPSNHIVMQAPWTFELDGGYTPGMAGTVAHELAHNLGLRHNYNDQFSSPEVCSTSNTADFFFDLYGASQSWCPNPPLGCDVCPHDFGNWCAPFVNDTLNYHCTNNLMGGVNFGDTYSITPLQMGRMHRSLMTYNVAKYAWGYDPVPYTMQQSETWDFHVKFYQDIVVPAGTTLTVTCELHMVPEARIVVEPGGRLIVDGGRIQAALYSPGPWRGIEVWGTSAEGQSPDPNDANYLEHQGLVELKNGGSVEGALMGIYLGNTDDPVGTSGGVLRMEGTSNAPFNTIRNCRIGVHFEPYSHQETIGQFTVVQANRSRFRFAHFVYDDAYVDLFDEPFIAHVDLNAVSGLNFLGCDFRNDRPTPTTSLELGYGIRSYNSKYTVNASCPTAPFNCSAGSLLPSRFVGLDHGIHATGAASSGYVSVLRSVFENNVCGVYANGITNPRVVNCDFTLGDRDVTMTENLDEFLWEGKHRGVFLTECSQIVVKDNDFQHNGTQLTDAIVVGYTRDNNAVVFRNSATGMDLGYVGEGISASVSDPWWVGLQFLCNENHDNTKNIKSRNAANAPLGDLLYSTIRQLQGGITGNYVHTADNYFDQCPGGVGSGELDFEVETNSLIVYLCRVTGQYYPQCFAGNFMAPVPDDWDPYPGCALLPFGPGEPQQYLADLQAYALSEKLAYGNVRYLYDDLIDGGNTDEVVLEIVSSWPQDAWELRAYLLGLSPYLSVEVLKEALDKQGFPDAMRAEVCIANPEATKQAGFMEWLKGECMYPLPEVLFNNILASWNEKTYRFTLEAQMAQHHFNCTQAVVEQLEVLQSDVDGVIPDKVREALQVLRIPGARYNEAFLLMEQHRYAEAATLVEAIPRSIC